MTAPPPARRIGYAERDAAVERLQQNHAEGRLTTEEFEERMQAALQAKTEADLEPLFLDLPAADTHVPALASSQGATAVEAADEQSDPDERFNLPADEPLWVNFLRILSWAAFPLAIVALIAFGEFWPMLIAIFIAPSGHAIADGFRRRHLEAQRLQQERKELR